MRRNPERVAWVILLLSFVVFCFIIVGVPLSIRWYIAHAEREHEASVESLVGTIVVELPVGRGPVPLNKGQSLSVPEGTVIRTDETSEAAIRFFEHSFMRLFSGSTVRLDRLCSPRYSSSPLPNSVRLSLLGGQVGIGTAQAFDAPLDFRIETLHAECSLEADGTYAVEATNDLSQIITHRGQALVYAANQVVRLEPRQRTEVVFGQPPQAATGAARNLVANGDFRQPLSEGWHEYNDQGNDGGDVDGHIEVVEDEGRRAVRLWRRGVQGDHCETVLEQTMDRRLPDPVSSLVVRATVKVRHQSLPGGGYLGSEYPLMIRLTYRDAYDSEAEWVQGFYYQNVANTLTMYGLQIPQGRWYPFQSENLLESLPVKPYKIVRLRVYASGWEYESLVSDISLIVE